MIYLAADKHGHKAIEYAEEYLKKNKIEYENLGARSTEDEIKLEDFIPRITKAVLASEENRGILSCGTGIGVVIGANRFSGIRACLATSEKVAELSAVYDKCNVLCLIGWNCERGNIDKILGAWLRSKYDGDEKRSKMFKVFDSWH